MTAVFIIGVAVILITTALMIRARFTALQIILGAALIPAGALVAAYLGAAGYCGDLSPTAIGTDCSRAPANKLGSVVMLVYLLAPPIVVSVLAIWRIARREAEGEHQ